MRSRPFGIGLLETELKEGDWLAVALFSIIARALKRSEQRQECPFQKQIQCARDRTVPAPSCRARAHPKPTPMLSRSAAGGEDPIGRAASRRRRGQSRRDLFAKKKSALAHSSAETHRAALAAASRARVKAQRAETRVPLSEANSMRSRSDCSGTLMSSASTSEAHAHVVAIRCWRRRPHRSSRLTPAPRPKPSRSFRKKGIGAGSQLG